MVFNCLNCSSIGAALSNVFQSRHMQFPLSLQLGAIAHGGWLRGSFYNVNLSYERIGIIHRSIRNSSLISCAQLLSMKVFTSVGLSRFVPAPKTCVRSFPGAIHQDKVQVSLRYTRDRPWRALLRNNKVVLVTPIGPKYAVQSSQSTCLSIRKARLETRISNTQTRTSDTQCGKVG